MNINKRALRKLVTADPLQTEQQRASLFGPGEFCGYKQSVYLDSRAPAQFFCLNALPSADAPRTSAALIARRNFLIEFDKMPSLAAQAERFEKRFGMPFVSKVYSGSKSLHYVIGVNEDLSDEDYRLTFKLFTNLFNNANDGSCINANRLSRTAGVVRDNGVRQELLALGARVAHSDLLKHVALFDILGYNRIIGEHQASKIRYEERLVNPIELDDSTPLPGWIQYMLDTGNFKGESRHAAMLKAAAGMKMEGYSLERIEGTLFRLQDAFALDRNDTPAILRWTINNL